MIYRAEGGETSTVGGGAAVAENLSRKRCVVQVEELLPGRPPPVDNAGTSEERPGDDLDQSGSGGPDEAHGGPVPGAGGALSEGPPWVRRR